MVTQQLQRCQVTGAPQQLLKSVAHRHHGHQGRSTNVLIPIERPGLGHILQGRIVDDNYRVVRQGTIWFQIAPVDLLGFQHIHLSRVKVECRSVQLWAAARGRHPTKPHESWKLEGSELTLALALLTTSTRFIGTSSNVWILWAATTSSNTAGRIGGCCTT